MKPASVLTKQKRIAELARINPVMAFTSLNHYLDYGWLLYAYKVTRKDGAVGVDGQTKRQYEENLKRNLENLLNKVKSGSYKAPLVRRSYVPKKDGSKREIGVPTFEDKVAQRVICLLLEPIYEQDFKQFSFGCREGKSAHMALQYLRNKIMEEGGRWLLDVDIRKYFDTIDRHKLREFLSKRVTDGVVRKMIDKWLKAGILEGEKISFAPAGTPAGSVASPLLANIYLHYVLDEWFTEIVTPRMEGRVSLTRFMDDFVIVFERYTDCKRVQQVLGKRLNKFGLSLHSDKTHVVDFRFKRTEEDQQRTWVKTKFNFLGFTHIWVSSREGKAVVLQRTAKDRYSKALKEISSYCKYNRHKALDIQHLGLCQRLRGWYNYFGITGNHRSLRNLRHRTETIWRKWLSRRSRKSKINWSKFQLILQRFPLPKAKVYHQFTAGVSKSIK